ncbi:MAG TPA: hypothetical protein VJQ51_04690, partial [Burkholderiales bacterium]|nr:hypothetical protein [Burkholderiales bacterium]
MSRHRFQFLIQIKRGNDLRLPYQSGRRRAVSRSGFVTLRNSRATGFLQGGGKSCDHSLVLLRRSALVTTETELIAMA